MATINKDFKIKNGLVVEGTTGTINGNTILTETAGDAYILDLIGGETLITSVESTQMEVISGELNIKSGVFDLDGAAAQALIDANDHTDTALLDYTTTANLDTTVGGYGYLKNADLPTMYSDSDVDAHLSGGDGITYSTGLIEAHIGTGLTTGLAGQTEINRATVDGWYDPAGAAGDVASDLSTHEGLTSGVHGVTGSVVGTTDTQVLTNKTINDELYFTNPATQANDGGIVVDNSSEDFMIRSYTANLELSSHSDLTLETLDGDIILRPSLGGAAYYGNTASAENEIATHGYVDNAVAGLNWKQAVNLLYDAAIPVLSGSGASQLIIDGHTPLGDGNSGYRVLITQSSDAGIYVFNSTSGNWALTRAADADTFEELVGAAVYVMEGTQYGSTSWVQGDHYLTNFTGQDWTQFSGQGSVTAGNGIVVDGLEVSIDTDIVATQTDLSDGLALKQDTLTAGNNIDITGATISVTGLTSAEISDFATAAQSAGTGYFDPAGSASTAETNANTYTNTALNDYTTTANLESTIDGYGFAYTSEIPSSTDAVSEGVNNLYFTDGRAKNSAMDILVNSNQNNITIAYNNANDGLVITAENGVADSTTNNLAEGTDNTGAGGANNLYFTNERVISAVDSADITPNSVQIDTFRKEEATQQYVTNAGIANVHSFSYPYESAKYLVRVVGSVGGTKHSQLSEILITTDGNNNIAITEYGITHTSTNPLATFSADDSNNQFTLTATTAVAGCEIIAAATMLSWAD